jgi:hypothetical protein
MYKWPLNSSGKETHDGRDPVEMYHAMFIFELEEDFQNGSFAS